MKNLTWALLNQGILLSATFALPTATPSQEILSLEIHLTELQTFNWDG